MAPSNSAYGLHVPTSMLSASMHSVVMLSAATQFAVMLIFVMLSVVLRSAVMLNVVLLSTVTLYYSFQYILLDVNLLSVIM